MGGNLLQRTRCYYFYDPSYRECNKRVPGSGCAAKQGYNRIHAILGRERGVHRHSSERHVRCAAGAGCGGAGEGPKGERSIPMAEFHRLPGNTPQIDTNLHPGELITAIDLPAMPYARRSTYLKVRDRNSYAFALVSVAAVLDLDERRRYPSSANRARRRGAQAWRAAKAERALAGKKTGGGNAARCGRSGTRGRKAVSRQRVQSGTGAAQHRARGDHGDDR